MTDIMPQAKPAIPKDEIFISFPPHWEGILRLYYSGEPFFLHPELLDDLHNNKIHQNNLQRGTLWFTGPTNECYIFYKDWVLYERSEWVTKIDLNFPKS